jgi:hypothetical protein
MICEIEKVAAPASSIGQAAKEATSHPGFIVMAVASLCVLYSWFLLLLTCPLISKYAV